jgi:hypothetical protein
LKPLNPPGPFALLGLATHALATNNDPAWIKAEWQRAVVQFREEIFSINKRISDYNLQAPSIRFQRPKINPDQEIQAIQAIQNNT